MKKILTFITLTVLLFTGQTFAVETIVANDRNIEKIVVNEIKRLGVNADLNHIDVSKVIYMPLLFRYSKFNGDISKWDVSNVTNMKRMFESSRFNGDISKWDVGNVTNMTFMFKGSKFSGDLSKWDAPKIPSYNQVGFASLAMNKAGRSPKIITNNINIKGDVLDEIKTFGINANLNHIDVSNVTDMRGMFYKSQFNGDISKWDVSNVTDMESMFRSSQFNGDISKWNVSNVTDMASMFGSSKFRSSKFNGDISKWDVSNVTDMGRMFGKSQFNGDISNWNVSNVTDMNWMFYESQFNDDISRWDVSSVTSMKEMFKNSKFNGDISKWWEHRDRSGTNTDDMLDKSILFSIGIFPGSKWWEKRDDLPIGVFGVLIFVISWIFRNRWWMDRWPSDVDREKGQYIGGKDNKDVLIALPVPALALTPHLATVIVVTPFIIMVFGTDMNISNNKADISFMIICAFIFTWFFGSLHRQHTFYEIKTLFLSVGLIFAVLNTLSHSYFEGTEWTIIGVVIFITVMALVVFAGLYALYRHHLYILLKANKPYSRRFWKAAQDLYSDIKTDLPKNRNLKAKVRSEGDHDTALEITSELEYSKRWHKLERRDYDGTAEDLQRANYEYNAAIDRGDRGFYLEYVSGTAIFAKQGDEKSVCIIRILQKGGVYHEKESAWISKFLYMPLVTKFSNILWLGSEAIIYSHKHKVAWGVGYKHQIPDCKKDLELFNKQQINE